jgi:hypothetical protein
MVDAYYALISIPIDFNHSIGWRFDKIITLSFLLNLFHFSLSFITLLVVASILQLYFCFYFKVKLNTFLWISRYTKQPLNLCGSITFTIVQLIRIITSDSICKQKIHESSRWAMYHYWCGIELLLCWSSWWHGTLVVMCGIQCVEKVRKVRGRHVKISNGVCRDVRRVPRIFRWCVRELGGRLLLD